MEEINSPEVEYEEDGSVWIYYKNQKMDITDKFEDGVCYVELKDGDSIQYMTVMYQNGYALSPERYLTPAEFNLDCPCEKLKISVYCRRYFKQDVYKRQNLQRAAIGGMQ